jgi:hypothetical protein
MCTPEICVRPVVDRPARYMIKSRARNKRGRKRTVILKAAGDRRKTIETGVKSPQFRRISGRCYRSSGLNGDVFCRNSAPPKNLELPRVGAILISSPRNDLRLITTIGLRGDYRNSFSEKDFGRRPRVSLGIDVHTKYNSSCVLEKQGPPVVGKVVVIPAHRPLSFQRKRHTIPLPITPGLHAADARDCPRSQAVRRDNESRLTRGGR